MTAPDSRADAAHLAVGQPAGKPGRLDDASLIGRCLDGDESAWEELIRRYQRLIYSIPIRYGMREEAAADVFQTVCVRLLENLGSLEDRGKLASWLVVTTKRECWQVTNKWRREAPIGEVDDEGAPAIEIVDERPLADEDLLLLERQQLLRQTLDQLPERSRALMEMLFFSEDRPSYEEISRRLGMPVASIGPTRARCLEKIRALLAAA